MSRPLLLLFVVHMHTFIRMSVHTPVHMPVTHACYIRPYTHACAHVGTHLYAGAAPPMFGCCNVSLQVPCRLAVLDRRVDMCVDMSVDMSVDMCGYMGADMCVDMCVAM